MSGAQPILLWTVPLVTMLGALATWMLGLRSVGILAATTVICWPGARLSDHASQAVAATGLITSALWAPFAAMLAWQALGGRRAGRQAHVFGAAACVVASLGASRLLVYEPFRDPACHRACVHSPLLVHPDLDLARSLAVAAAWSALAMWGLVGARAAGETAVVHRTARIVPVAVVATAGVAVVSAGFAAFRRPVAMPELASPTVESLRLATGAGLALFIGALAADRWLLWRRVRRVGEMIAGATQSAQAQLATALGDPGVVVRHVLGGTDLQLEPPSPGRRRTELSSRGTAVAIIDHAANVEPEALQRRLGPRVRLAVHNEGLRLELERQLEAVAASRRRIIEVADDERARLEHDLHDGAQQRVLALSLELRRGERRAEQRDDPHTAAIFGAANKTALAVLDGLREIAHGIHPAALETAGLAAALRHLATADGDAIDLRVGELGTLPVHARRTAYSVVCGCAATEVDIERVGDDLTSMRRPWT